jgi:hypothetical protein
VERIPAILRSSAPWRMQIGPLSNKSARNCARHANLGILVKNATWRKSTNWDVLWLATWMRWNTKKARRKSRLTDITNELLMKNTSCIGFKKYWWMLNQMKPRFRPNLRYLGLIKAIWFSPPAQRSRM